MITRLILKNYKPSLTKGLAIIDLDLNHLITVILGVNGISKTSVLKEANPLPPENGNFGKNGYKKIWITENNKHYELESFTGSKSRHSFKIVTGVDQFTELNPNGTQTVQRELVKQHLFITNKMCRVLNGLDIRDLFTYLTTNARKDIFMDFYPNDVTYSLNVYNKLKTSLRDTTGAINNQTKRLAEEQQRYKKLQEMNNEELTEKISHIDNQLKDALILQGSLSNSFYNDTDFMVLHNRFTKLVNELVLFNFNDYKYPISSLKYLIKKQSDILNYKQNRANKLEARINELSIGLSGLSITEQDPAVFENNLILLRNELTQLEDKQNKYRVLLNQLPVFNEYDLSNLIPYTQLFIDYLNAITLSTKPELSNAMYKEFLAEREITNNKLRSVEAELDEHRHTLKHFDNANLVECEDCHHQFKPGFKAEDINKLKVRITVLNNDKTALQTKLNLLDNNIDIDADWYSSMQSLILFIRENKTVDFLMLLVKSYDIGKVSSDALINGLKMNYDEFKLKERVIALKEEEKVLEARLSVLKRNDMITLLNELKETELLLGDCNQSIFGLRDDIKNYEDQLDSLNSYQTKLTILAKYKEDLLDALVNKGRVDLKDRVEEAIAELSPIKDNLINDLIRSKSTFNVILNIEENIANLKKRSKHLKTLVDGLCPNKGLIGKLMLDFITKVCGNMNAIIREVWVNPLYIKPCSNDNDEINYLFPVINSYDNSANNDIGECSGGEREIINLAFRIVMLSYIDGEFPLFMDEVGGALDEVHRTRFFDYVKQFCNTGRIKQMFMISHYVNQYGMLDNANIIKLSGTK